MEHAIAGVLFFAAACAYLFFSAIRIAMGAKRKIFSSVWAKAFAYSRRTGSIRSVARKIQASARPL